MSYTQILASSGAIQLSSVGVIDLDASTYVSCPEIRPTAALGLAYGGLGASCANTSEALTAIGAQPLHAKLTDISGLAPGSGNVISWNGTNFVASAASVYTADDVTLALTGSEFAIKDGGVDADALGANAVTSAKLHSSVASTGISFNSGALQVDSSAVCMLSGSQTVAGVKTLSSQPVLQAGLKKQNSGAVGYADELMFEQQSTDDTPFYFAFDIPNDSSVFVEAEIVACDAAMDDVAAYKLNGLVKNNNGTSSALQLNDLVIYEADAALACVLSINDTEDELRINCTGIAATNIKWVCHAKFCVAPKYA
jgi:hypothetical protein